MKSKSASVTPSILPPPEDPNNGSFSLRELCNRSDIARAKIGQPPIPPWQIQDYLAGLIEMGALTWDWEIKRYRG